METSDVAVLTEEPPISTSVGEPEQAPAQNDHEEQDPTDEVFVFALGRIEPRLPTLELEKEFAQATGRTDTAGLSDHQVLHSVLSDRANRYLARQLCWVLLIEGLETYVLLPRDPTDLDLLIEAVRSGPSRDDVDVVVGSLGPVAPPEACGGLAIPMVAFDQVWSFDRQSLLESMPRPEAMPAKDDAKFRSTAGELFDRIMQIADNAGANDEHRALNYLAVRYPAIYAVATEAHDRGASLTGVTVRPSRLSSVRRIVDVVFSYTHRQTDVTEQYFVRCDVTGRWPFLVTKLAPYFER